MRLSECPEPPVNLAISSLSTLGVRTSFAVDVELMSSLSFDSFSLDDFRRDGMLLGGADILFFFASGGSPDASCSTSDSESVFIMTSFSSSVFGILGLCRAIFYRVDFLFRKLIFFRKSEHLGH